MEKPSSKIEYNVRNRGGNIETVMQISKLMELLSKIIKQFIFKYDPVMYCRRLKLVHMHVRHHVYMLNSFMRVNHDIS